VAYHVSHAYRDGASLYYTFLAPMAPEGREEEQWVKTKRAASDAIMEGGGTITHHHGIGYEHAPWMREEVGEVSLDALRSLKKVMDPAGILNPGKLFPRY
jgi:alkyldihydroxyacetonephosphate synthase